ncbi:MAG: hypothetical protein DRO39_02185 [Thermoprotei archaeon]|nr:MAG: hypothetical protein DRO39_02185 [Thermoprotei archaeon]
MAEGVSIAEYRKQLLKERLLRIKETILLVLRHRSAIIGLAIVLFYSILGALAPVLTPYDPVMGMDVADAFAVPEWVAAPDTPRNVEGILDNYKIVDKSVVGDVKVLMERLSDGSIAVKVSGVGEANITIVSEDTLYYPYRPARSMLVKYGFKTTKLGKEMGWYNIAFAIENIDLRERGAVLVYKRGDRELEIPKGLYVVYDEVGFRMYSPFPLVREEKNVSTSIRLPYYVINAKQPVPMPDDVNAVSEILLEKDTRLRAVIYITYSCSSTSAMMRCSDGGIEFLIQPLYVKIYGLAHGILGTNYLGVDVWSQFVYGARIAVVLGLSVALATVLLGIVVGVLAGYRVGTLFDYVATFIIDVIYFTPLLPLIMAVGIVFGRRLDLIFSVFILLSWPGTARLARSWSMALRSDLYIEAAKAVGASDMRIVIKHIVPQLVPLLVYSLVLRVPGVIMTEAAISLIGFGDPHTPSWGKMINEAFYGGAFLQNAWWWIMPPIVGIVTIALGFALLGIALDEIVNPRLRRR